ncbi:MAG: DNA repair protein RecO [Sulfuricellaceae bacterium]|nr:DNA repair protein RecO [Sulfuricellaceae bacterium]
MLSSDKLRIDGQPGYVLHSYAYRETSLVVETFTRNHGRVAMIARGARRPKSSLRGSLLSFQPLQLSWFGKNELRTLHQAEWQGGLPHLHGMALICGFYLNELLLKLLIRDDPHESLFAYYEETLRNLVHTEEHATVLRRFEKVLLQELGYGLVLDRDCGNGQTIRLQGRYHYMIEQGPREAESSSDGVQLHGKTLLDMACDDYTDPVTQQQSKLLMRTLINHYLGDQTLHTRQLLKDLQQL